MASERTSEHSEERRRKRSGAGPSEAPTERSGQRSNDRTGIHVFDGALETANCWIRDIMTELHSDSPEEAYKALRAVLHTLRERLPLEETMHLAAQLPQMIKGTLFDGYSASTSVVRYDRDEFFERVAERLRAAAVPNPDPMRYAHAVIRTLMSKMSEGELDDVRGTLPKDMQGLWDMFEQEHLADSTGRRRPGEASPDVRH
jgi:uncharacterized protein (DUF2267 family)